MKLETFGKIKTYQYEFWGRDGENCLEKDSLAHSTTSKDTGVTRYYIRGHGRILYDVQSREGNYSKKYPWKKVMVSKEAYGQYVQFLKTKRRRFLALAERH